jgi:hypothetical protein
VPDTSTIRGTVSINNAGRGSAADVVLELTHPTGAPLLSSDPVPTGSTVNGDETVEQWDFAVIPGPGHEEVAIELGVPAGTTDGSAIDLSAEVVDAIARHGSDSATVTVRSDITAPDPNDVSLFMDLTAPSTVLAGNELRTTVTASNAGRSDTSGVVVAMVVPDTIELVLALPNPTSVSTGDGETLLVWDLGVLPGPGNTNISARYLVPGSTAAGSAIGLSAAVSDNAGHGASASATTAVRD